MYLAAGITSPGLVNGSQSFGDTWIVFISVTMTTPLMHLLGSMEITINRMVLSVDIDCSIASTPG